MPIRHLRSTFVLLTVFFAAAIWVAGCSGDKKGKIEQADKLYLEAVSFDEQFQYEAALKKFGEAVQLDTALGRSENAREDFFREGCLYARLGFFAESLSAFNLARSYTLTQNASTLTDIVRQEAAIAWLTGNSSLALEHIRSLPTPRFADQLQAGDIYFSLDSLNASREAYNAALSSASSNVEKIKALAGLARTAAALGNATEADKYLLQLISLNKDVMKSDLAAEIKIEAGRIAGAVLASFPAHVKDASWFLNRSLTLLGPAGGRDVEKALLQIQINAIGPKRANVYEKAMAVFEDKKYEQGLAYAAVLAGFSPDYTPDRRIEVIQKGLDVVRDNFYTVPDAAIQKQLQRAGFELIDLFSRRARYLEAYENLERNRMVAQMAVLSHAGIELQDKDAAAILNDLRRQVGVIGGLQQLQDSLVFLDKADAAARAEFLEKNLSEKTGQFFQTLADLKKKNPNYAEFIRPTAPTLPTLQELLDDGTAVAEVFQSDSLVTTIFITKQAVEVFRSSVAADTVTAALQRLKAKFFGGEQEFKTADIQSDEAVQKLSTVFYAPLVKNLPALKKIYIVSDLDIPFHLLGDEKRLIESVEVSYLTSAKQIELDRNIKAPRRTVFITPVETKTIGEKYFDDTRESILCFKPLSPEKLADEKIIFDLALKDAAPLSQILQSLAREKISKDMGDWISYAAYGF